VSLATFEAIKQKGVNARTFSRCSFFPTTYARLVSILVYKRQFMLRYCSPTKPSRLFRLWPDITFIPH